MKHLAVGMFGGDCTAWLCCSPKEEQNDSSYTTCPQPLEGAEGSCPSGENWLIFIESWLSTACTISLEKRRLWGNLIAAFQDLKGGLQESWRGTYVVTGHGVMALN